MIHNKIVDLRNSGEKRSVILPREICKKKISNNHPILNEFSVPKSFFFSVEANDSGTFLRRNIPRVFLLLLVLLLEVLYCFL